MAVSANGKLARVMALAVVEEFGPEVFLDKISDPFWFQTFGCVLGFDWHSSGLTITTCGALKVDLKGLEKDSGFDYRQRDMNCRCNI